MILLKPPYYYCCCILLVMVVACKPAKVDTLFSLIPATQTGIYFSNDIQENDTLQSFINEFGYMGGGVGIGDFNHDGLPDIFFLRATR
ncbi:hypothetical protein [Paraflavitalea speifideaquila]|uniref:hypothetical protein n=1 Tax=Paraflavitalea speifideaquila TaxID=3076558 RepID=UPI0028F0AEBE|nr:hypothetical protein [Paraflavitalea speifideiaquila]